MADRTGLIRWARSLPLWKLARTVAYQRGLRDADPPKLDRVAEDRLDDLETVLWRRQSDGEHH